MKSHVCFLAFGVACTVYHVTKQTVDDCEFSLWWIGSVARIHVGWQSPISHWNCPNVSRNSLCGPCVCQSARPLHDGNLTATAISRQQKNLLAIYFIYEPPTSNRCIQQPPL